MKSHFSSLLVAATLLVGTVHAETQVSGLDKPQIRFSDIEPHLERVKNNELFEVNTVGHSYWGLPVYRISHGTGPTTVLMWSQMHGDESTATPALFDLMEHMTQNPEWTASWADDITLHMIPMLNPDGAELAQRYNAQGFDVNRDARVLQSPEGRILMAQAKALEPVFGFNLHDQGRYYEVGDTGKTATISVLAPAFNVAKDINESRQRAMQAIGVLKEVVEAHIPGHLARYDDTYAHRAFGDTLASMGISTILIESGAHKGDPNRQVARKLNVAMLIRSLDSIANKEYEQQTLAPYNAIPMNNYNSFKDLIARNVTVVDGEHEYQLDIAINIGSERASIRDLGDLSPFPAFNDKDASGLQYQAGNGYAIAKPLTLTNETYKTLLAEGYSYFTGNSDLLNVNTEWPVVINPRQAPQNRPQRDDNGTFLLSQGDKVTHAVLRGQWIEL